MPVLSHHSMANLLVLDPSMGKIWVNEHFYGYPLTKPTAIPLYYEYIDHLDALPLPTRLTAYPTTALVSSIHRGASCHDALLNVWTIKCTSIGEKGPLMENQQGGPAAKWHAQRHATRPFLLS